MDRPLSRVLAATCVVWLAFATGAARADWMPSRLLDWVQRGTDCPMPEEGPKQPKRPDLTILPWPEFPDCDDNPSGGEASELPISPGKCPTLCEILEHLWTCFPTLPPTTSQEPGGGEPTDPSTTVNHAPEPSALVLFGLGSLGLMCLRRRSRR